MVTNSVAVPLLLFAHCGRISTMNSLRHLDEERPDIAADLVKTLPAWVRWVPVVGRVSYAWWQRRKAKREPQNTVDVELFSAGVDAHARDEANMEFVFLVVNYGPHLVEIDR